MGVAEGLHTEGVGDRRRALLRLGLTGPGLAVVAVVGFLLAACGGGDGSAVTRYGRDGDETDRDRHATGSHSDQDQ